MKYAIATCYGNKIMRQQVGENILKLQKIGDVLQNKIFQMSNKSFLLQLTDSRTLAELTFNEQ